MKLSAMKAKKVVLYFYPKDNTPGLHDRRARVRRRPQKFEKAGARDPGVSRDSLKSHEGFKDKMGFPFELIEIPTRSCAGFRCDEDEEHVRQAGARHRAQHLRDRRRRQAAREWRGVKVPGHVDEVLAFVQSL